MAASIRPYDEVLLRLAFDVAKRSRAGGRPSVRLANEGATREGIAKELGVSVASVYRALAAARSEAAGQALRARK